MKLIFWDCWADQTKRYRIEGVLYYVAARSVIRGRLSYLLFPESHKSRGIPDADGLIVTVDGRCLARGVRQFSDYTY